MGSIFLPYIATQKSAYLSSTDLAVMVIPSNSGSNASNLNWSWTWDQLQAYFNVSYLDKRTGAVFTQLFKDIVWNLDQMQAFVNGIDVTVINNYFQTYTFSM